MTDNVLTRGLEGVLGLSFDVLEAQWTAQCVLCEEL